MPPPRCRAAIDIQRAVGSRTFGDQGVALDTRIGISTGNVIGGSVGAGQRLSFTLLGDTVNLAARLEELNKKYGTRILLSRARARPAATASSSGRWAGCRARPQRCGRRLQHRPQRPGKAPHERLRLCRPTN